MRLTILKDKKITDDQLDRLRSDFMSMFPIRPTFFEHERDFSYYPTYPDSDGDLRPTNQFLVDETDFVHSKYGLWGTDHVFIFIHEDNWRSSGKNSLTPRIKEELLKEHGYIKDKGIWGTNYSNIYHGYQVHYCRYDKDNPANALGTFYHEVMHSFDALIKTETGTNIAPLIPVADWDRSVVHGQDSRYEYIRYKENIEVVDYIKPYLLKSYANRKARFDEQVGLMTNVVQLLQTLVVLLRQQLNRKNGVNKCTCLNHDH